MVMYARGFLPYRIRHVGDNIRHTQACGEQLGLRSAPCERGTDEVSFRKHLWWLSAKQSGGTYGKV